MRYLAAILLLASYCAARPCQGYMIAWQDDLGNVLTGFPPGTSDKLEIKLSKKYPGVCYDQQSTTILFISSRPAVYHGVSTSTHQSPVEGKVSNSSGEQLGTMSGTVETHTSEPYTVDYKRLYLTVQRQFSGKPVIVQSFSGKTLHPTMYGFCTHNCHPSEALIESGVKWLSTH